MGGRSDLVGQPDLTQAGGRNAISRGGVVLQDVDHDLVRQLCSISAQVVAGLAQAHMGSTHHIHHLLLLHMDQPRLKQLHQIVCRTETTRARTFYGTLVWLLLLGPAAGV